MISPTGTSQFVFCPPLPGKPNPNETWDPEVGDTRSRVEQSAQKGDTCYYYALNTIRTRYGKNAPASLCSERNMEAIISRYRKGCTQINNELKWQRGFAREIIESMNGTRCTKKVVMRLLKNPAFPPMNTAMGRVVLESFCKQNVHTDLLSYTTDVYSKAIQDNQHKLFDDLRISNKDRDQMVQSLCKGKPQNPLTTLWAMDGLIKNILAQAYDLQKSTWHPSQPITSLVEQLRLFGPHVVCGAIGQVFYEEPPVKLNTKVDGRSVFGWKSNHTKKEFSSLWHSVTIVGARSDTGHVYFIDPLDGSKPNEIETQILYMMPYEKFKSSLCTLFNFYAKTNDGEVIFSPPSQGENEYALHAKKICTLTSNFTALKIESMTTFSS